MRKILTSIFCIALVFSCATKPNQNNKDLPEWVLTPQIAEDAIYGIGYANLERYDKSLSVAKTRARRDIASQLETQIKSATVDYYQEAGIKKDNQAMSYVEEITKEVIDKKLVNTRMKATYNDKVGGVWVMISYNFEDAKKAYEEASAEVFQRSDSAAFAEFKAKEALKFLDSQLENKPTTSVPVEE